MGIVVQHEVAHFLWLTVCVQRMDCVSVRKCGCLQRCC